MQFGTPTEKREDFMVVRSQTVKRFILRKILNGFFAANLLLIPLCTSIPANGCSDIMLPRPDSKAEDKTAVSARTMDYMFNVRDFLEVVPRGRQMTSPDPDATHHMKGISWKAPYGFVGISSVWYQNYEHGTYLEGMNEYGFSAGMLALNESCQQERGGCKNGFPDPKPGAKNLSIQFVAGYLLGQCKNVAEAIQALEEVNVWHQEMDFTLPISRNRSPVIFKMPMAFHLVLHDNTHTSAVVEWVNKKQNIYPSSAIGVLANDPAYPKQLEQLKMFDDLTAENGFKKPPGRTLAPTDHTLPGDSWSSSRFVRLNKLTNSAENSYRPLGLGLFSQTPKLWRVQQANRIISRAEEVYGEIPDNVVTIEAIRKSWKSPLHTLYTVIRDHTNRHLYFRGVYNAALRKVDLTRLSFDRPNKYGLSWMFVDPDSATPGYYLDFAQDVTSLLTGADASISGSAFSAKLTMDYTFQVSQEDKKQLGSDAGQVFIFRRDPDKRLYYWDVRSGKWVESVDSILQPSYSGKLQTVEFKDLFKKDPISRLKGAKIYAGYGLNQTEMLMSGRFGLIYAVQNPYGMRKGK
jgi:choloylglycine hydrolase